MKTTSSNISDIQPNLKNRFKISLKELKTETTPDKYISSNKFNWRRIFILFKQEHVKLNGSRE